MLFKEFLFKSECRWYIKAAFATFVSMLIIFQVGVAQEQIVLHYTETSGFDHGTRVVSFNMFNDIGEILGFTVDDDETGESFNTLENLQQYDVVVFSNTSGNSILNETQRSNFEAYINGGGAYIGIHAASDTYRHSSANGGSTGTWDWYAEMAGASVQQSPNHTSANYNGTMNHLLESDLLEEIPDPWNKVEEYYYWESGYYNDNNVAILEVQSTGNQSYDEPRPMAWFKELPQGGRSFYTALGHASSNYTSNEEFRQLILNALVWSFQSGAEDCAGVPNGEAFLDVCGICVGGTTGVEPCVPVGIGSISWNEACGSRNGVLYFYEPGTDALIESIELEIPQDGTFDIGQLPTPSLDAFLKLEGYLQKAIYSVEVNEPLIGLDFGSLTPGEISGDNLVGAADFSIFSSSYGAVEGNSNYNILADINCDSAINIADYAIFSANYGLIGDQP